jgi:MarR family transcriptional regulator, organic hydroperoxide resistance regulator
MVQAVMARKEHMATVAAKFELSLPQAHLLRLLQHGPARTMTSLAGALACDASNVTGIVDRLESRGLINRGSAGHDRRITTITLTARGKDVLAELHEGFLQPPETLCRLSEQQLSAFRKLVILAFGRWQDEVKSPELAPRASKSRVGTT